LAFLIIDDILIRPLGINGQEQQQEQEEPENNQVKPIDIDPDSGGGDVGDSDE
jgi:hypothetical protein